MAKKNHERLIKIHEALNRFKKIKEQDPGDNEIFTESVNLEMQRLFNEEHKEITRLFEQPKKPNKPKMEISENPNTSLGSKGNFTYGTKK